MRVKILFATVRTVNNDDYSLILVSDQGGLGFFDANLKSCNDSPSLCICTYANRHMFNKHMENN